MASMSTVSSFRRCRHAVTATTAPRSSSLAPRGQDELEAAAEPRRDLALDVGGHLVHLGVGDRVGVVPDDDPAVLQVVDQLRLGLRRGVDAPVGDPARIPVRTGRGRDRRVRVRSPTGRSAGGARQSVPALTCVPPSLGSWTPRFGSGSPPSTMTRTIRITPISSTPPMARSRQSGRDAPPPVAPASMRRLSASLLARSRRWIPDVRRRLVIRRRRIPDLPSCRRGTRSARW